MWFFTASNPTLTFGGYQGERKSEMYNLLPLGTLPNTTLIPWEMPAEQLVEIIASNRYIFPLAVKPDIGRMGLMFRKIDSILALLQYHGRMRVDYLVQDFVDYPLEVSVFYYRYPNQSKGCITGFVKKEPLIVTGDGQSSLWELIMQDPRAQLRLEEMKVRHRARLNEILSAGEQFLLCEALNLSRGGKLVSLEAEKDEALLHIFDELSHRGQFFFGRYDIRCKSIEDLKQGTNFSILEFNGSGAEPHHVYGNGNSFFKAVRILLSHWQILADISRQNYQRGIHYWDFKRGLRHIIHANRHIRTLEELELITALDERPARGKVTADDFIPQYEQTADKLI